jgi:hypothetical protein
MRHQKVLTDNIKVNDSISLSREEIKNGIPQSLISSLLFFLFYISNLPQLAATDTNIVLYVDELE